MNSELHYELGRAISLASNLISGFELAEDGGSFDMERFKRDHEKLKRILCRAQEQCLPHAPI